MEQLPKIKTILSCAGIPIFGCCPFEPLRPQILECRAKERLPADAKSIFVALFPYAMEEAAYQGGNLSRYAAVGDYHEIVPQYLKRDRREYEGTITWISDKSEFTPKTIQTRDERANLVYATKIAVKNDGYIKIGMYGEMKK